MSTEEKTAATSAEWEYGELQLPRLPKGWSVQYVEAEKTEHGVAFTVDVVTSDGWSLGGGWNEEGWTIGDAILDQLTVDHIQYEYQGDDPSVDATEPDLVLADLVDVEAAIVARVPLLAAHRTQITASHREEAAARDRRASDERAISVPSGDDDTGPEMTMPLFEDAESVEREATSSWHRQTS